MSVRETVRSYYAAIDDGAYDDLEAALAPSFAHDRPDRTIEGRDAFVAFMRDDRPLTDTSHEVRSIVADGNVAVVEGRLLDADGDALFRFADVHEVADGQITEIRTYTA